MASTLLVAATKVLSSPRFTDIALGWLQVQVVPRRQQRQQQQQMLGNSKVISSLGFTDIGGVGSITGQVNLTSQCTNVIEGLGLGQLNTAEGLDLNATLQVASDAML